MTNLLCALDMQIMTIIFIGIIAKYVEGTVSGYIQVLCVTIFRTFEMNRTIYVMLSMCKYHCMAIWHLARSQLSLDRALLTL